MTSKQWKAELVPVSDDDDTDDELSLYLTAGEPLTTPKVIEEAEKADCLLKQPKEIQGPGIFTENGSGQEKTVEDKTVSEFDKCLSNLKAEQTLPIDKNSCAHIHTNIKNELNTPRDQDNNTEVELCRSSCASMSSRENINETNETNTSDTVAQRNINDNLIEEVETTVTSTPRVKRKKPLKNKKRPNKSKVTRKRIVEQHVDCEGKDIKLQENENIKSVSKFEAQHEEKHFGCCVKSVKSNIEQDKNIAVGNFSESDDELSMYLMSGEKSQLQRNSILDICSVSVVTNSNEKTSEPKLETFDNLSQNGFAAYEQPKKETSEFSLDCKKDERYSENEVLKPDTEVAKQADTTVPVKSVKDLEHDDDTVQYENLHSNKTSHSDWEELTIINKGVTRLDENVKDGSKSHTDSTAVTCDDDTYDEDAVEIDMDDPLASYLLNQNNEIPKATELRTIDTPVNSESKNESSVCLAVQTVNEKEPDCSELPIPGESDAGCQTEGSEIRITKPDKHHFILQDVNMSSEIKENRTEHCERKQKIISTQEIANFSCDTERKGGKLNKENQGDGCKSVSSSLLLQKRDSGCVTIKGEVSKLSPCNKVSEVDNLLDVDNYDDIDSIDDSLALYLTGIEKNAKVGITEIDAGSRTLSQENLDKDLKQENVRNSSSVQVHDTESVNKMSAFPLGDFSEQFSINSFSDVVSTPGLNVTERKEENSVILADSENNAPTDGKLSHNSNVLQIQTKYETECQNGHPMKELCKINDVLPRSPSAVHVDDKQNSENAKCDDKEKTYISEQTDTNLPPKTKKKRGQLFKQAKIEGSKSVLNSHCNKKRDSDSAVIKGYVTDSILRNKEVKQPMEAREYKKGTTSSNLPKRAKLEAKFSVHVERELKNLMIDMKGASRNIDKDINFTYGRQTESSSSDKTADKINDSFKSDPDIYGYDSDSIDDPLASYLGSDTNNQKEEVTQSEMKQTSLSFDHLKTNKNPINDNCLQVVTANSENIKHDISVQIDPVEDLGGLDISQKVDCNTLINLQKGTECDDSAKTEKTDLNYVLLKSAVSNENFIKESHGNSDDEDDSDDPVPSNVLSSNNESSLNDTSLNTIETPENKDKYGVDVIRNSLLKDSSQKESQTCKKYLQVEKQLKQEQIWKHSPIKQKDIESLNKMFDYSSKGFSEQVTIKSPSEIVTEPHSNEYESKQENRSVVEIIILNAEETCTDMNTRQVGHSTPVSNDYVNEISGGNLKNSNSDKNLRDSNEVKESVVQKIPEQSVEKDDFNKFKFTAVTDKIHKDVREHYRGGNDNSQIKDRKSKDQHKRVLDFHSSGKSEDSLNVSETNMNESQSVVSSRNLNETEEKSTKFEFQGSKPNEMPQFGRFIRKNNKLCVVKDVNGKPVLEEFLSSKLKKETERKLSGSKSEICSKNVLPSRSANREIDHSVAHVGNQEPNLLPFANNRNQLTGMCVNDGRDYGSYTNKTEICTQTNVQNNSVFGSLQNKRGHDSGLKGKLTCASVNVGSELVEEYKHGHTESKEYEHSNVPTQFERDSEDVQENNTLKDTATIRVYRVEQSPNKTGLVTRKFIILQDDGRYQEIESVEFCGQPLDNSVSASTYSQALNKDAEVLIPEIETDAHANRFNDLKTSNGTNNEERVFKPLLADVASQSQTPNNTFNCNCKSSNVSFTEQVKQIMHLKQHRQKIRNLKTLVQLKKKLELNKMKEENTSRPCIDDKQLKETNREELVQQQTLHTKGENNHSKDNGTDLNIREIKTENNPVPLKSNSDQEEHERPIKSVLHRDTAGSELKRKRDENNPTKADNKKTKEESTTIRMSSYERVPSRIDEELNKELKQPMEAREYKKGTISSNLPKRAKLEAKFSVPGERELKNLMIAMKGESRNIDTDINLTNGRQTERDSVQTRLMRVRVTHPKQIVQSNRDDGLKEEIMAVNETFKEKGHITARKDSSNKPGCHKYKTSTSNVAAVSGKRELKNLVIDMKSQSTNLVAESKVKGESESVKTRVMKRRETLSNSSKEVTKTKAIEDIEKKESLKIDTKERKKGASRSSSPDTKPNSTRNQGTNLYQRCNKYLIPPENDQILESELIIKPKHENTLNSSMEKDKLTISKNKSTDQMFRPNIAIAMEECLQQVTKKHTKGLKKTEIKSIEAKKFKMGSENETNNIHTDRVKEVKKIRRPSNILPTNVVENERHLCEVCGRLATHDSSKTDCMLREKVFVLGEKRHSESEVSQDNEENLIEHVIKNKSNTEITKISVSQDKAVDQLKSKQKSKGTQKLLKVRFKEPSKVSRKETTLKRTETDLTENKTGMRFVKKRKVSNKISNTKAENKSQTCLIKVKRHIAAKDKVSETKVQSHSGISSKLQNELQNQTLDKTFEEKGSHCSSINLLTPQCKDMKEFEHVGKSKQTESVKRKETVNADPDLNTLTENEMDLMPYSQIGVNETDDNENISCAKCSERQNLTKDLDNADKKGKKKNKHLKIWKRNKELGRQKYPRPGFSKFYVGRGKMGFEGWKDLLCDKAFHFHDIIQEQRKPDVKHVKRLLGRVLNKTKNKDQDKRKKHKGGRKVGTTKEHRSQESAMAQKQSCHFQSFQFSPTVGERASHSESETDVETPFLSLFRYGMKGSAPNATATNEPISIARIDSGPQVEVSYRVQNEKPPEQSQIVRVPTSQHHNISVGQLLNMYKVQS